MKKILSELFKGKSLSKEEAEKVMLNISEGKVNAAQTAAFLTVYLMRAMTADEFLGFREALLQLCLPVDLGTRQTIDIVGTGGDGKNTFNISTVSCFVVAGAGFKVTKHGNYASSSVTGSSNVLEYLGYRFTNDTAVLKNQLYKNNLTFLHAPLFHPALKSVAPIRKELGLRTIFNLLGPVVNPAKPKYQLLGVYSYEIGQLYAELLQKADVKHTIVHSADGYDEISLTDEFIIFSNGKKNIVKPEEINFKKINPDELSGGKSVADAAKIFVNILLNKATNAQKEVVMVNSAYAISTISGKSIDESLAMAKESLESGKAYTIFKNLVR